MRKTHADHRRRIADRWQEPSASAGRERTAMDIRLVRRTLLDIAKDQSPEKPDDAIQAVAIALLYIAEGVEEMKATLARLSVAPVPKKPTKRPSRVRSRRVKQKKG